MHVLKMHNVCTYKYCMCLVVHDLSSPPPTPCVEFLPPLCKWERSADVDETN